MITWRALTFSALLAGTIVPACAQSILLDSYGSYTDTTDSNGHYTGWTQSESVLYPPTLTGGYAALTSLSGTITDPIPALPYGTYSYSDGSGDSLTVLVDFTAEQYSSANNFYSASGTWSFESGTGSYAAVTSGEGTFSLTQITQTSSGSSGTLLAGVLTPAPEPTTCGLLAAGAAAFVRRKRRKI